MRRYVGIGVILVVALVTSLSLMHGRARAASGHGATSGREEPMSYTPPTGPEMEPAQIQELAVAIARSDGVTGALKVSIAHSTARAATNVLNGSSAQAQTATEGAWERAPSYAVVMEAPTGEYFSPNEPEPRRAAPIHQKFWAIVMEAQNGYISAEYGGPTPPALEELGPVISSTVAPLSSVAETAEPANGGIIVWLKPPHVGWPVKIIQVGGHRSMIRKYTSEGARFRIEGGDYIVEARRCGSRRVHLGRRNYVNVTLDCH
jgi:hypothetical protein